MRNFVDKPLCSKGSEGVSPSLIFRGADAGASYKRANPPFRGVFELGFLACGREGNHSHGSPVTPPCGLPLGEPIERASGPRRSARAVREGRQEGVRAFFDPWEVSRPDASLRLFF